MISLADLKAHLGVTGSADDARLEALEQRMVAKLGRATNRYFGAPQPVTRVLDSMGRQHVWLPDALASLDGVVVEVRASQSSDWEVLDAADLELIPPSDPRGPSQLLRKDRTWPTGPRTVRVSYSEGWAEGEAPDDLQQAVLDLCTSLERRRDQQGVKAAEVDGIKLTFGEAGESLGNDVQDTIDRWKRSPNG